MEKTDNELVILAQSGDTTAFAVLYDRYIKKIYRYFSYRTDRKETAEDLTSQTFTKALSSLKSFSTKRGDWSPWLYKIAHNVLIDHLRKNKTTENIDTILDKLQSPENTDTTVETRIAYERAKKLLESLPEKTQKIIIMRLWDDMTYLEISQTIGKSESACKMIFSRGLKTLREQLPISILLSIFLHQIN